MAGFQRRNGLQRVDHTHTFNEALEIIRLLWQGAYQNNYDGRYLKLEGPRVFDPPDVLPTMAVAVSGPSSVRHRA